VKLVGEIVPDAVVGYKLKLRHINGLGLDPGPVLDRFGDGFWKRGHEPVAVFIREYLGAVFGYDP